MPYAIVIDDDPGFQEALVEVVRQEGFAVDTAGTLAGARKLVAARPPDLALLDVSLPDGSGSDLLAELADQPGIEVVLVTGHATVGSVIDALRRGASDYLTKPVDLQRLKSVLVNVARRRELSEEVARLRDELRTFGRFGAMIGASAPMQRVYDQIGRVAPTSATVFVHGESGTGKELVAQTVHQLSRRQKQPFIALNCGAVSPQLIESELFGHERGAFTGADRSHRGYFERAHGGTLFLDEIGDMPLELQVKLLRVLETGCVARIGGEKDIPVDVRVVAATNRDPDQAVAESKLRQDLLYRLSVFPIELPPLRERTGDVDLFADAFLADLNRAESTAKRLTPAALAALGAYAWPGNVRELKNTLHRAFIMADEAIDLACLPPAIAGASAAPVGDPEAPAIVLPVGTTLDDAERQLILATLERTSGNKERAARQLGISTKTLYNKLQSYKLPKEA